MLQMCMSYSTYRYTPVQGQVCSTAETGMLRCRDSMLNSKHTLYCTQVCCAADVHVILHIQVHSTAGTGMFHCRQVCCTGETGILHGRMYGRNKCSQDICYHFFSHPHSLVQIFLVELATQGGVDLGHHRSAVLHTPLTLCLVNKGNVTCVLHAPLTSCLVKKGNIICVLHAPLTSCLVKKGNIICVLHAPLTSCLVKKGNIICVLHAPLTSCLVKKGNICGLHAPLTSCIVNKSNVICVLQAPLTSCHYQEK